VHKAGANVTKLCNPVTSLKAQPTLLPSLQFELALLLNSSLGSSRPINILPGE
jgi:hypothetical protein